MLFFIIKFGLNYVKFQSSMVGRTIEMIELIDKAIQISSVLTSSIALLTCCHAQMLILFYICIIYIYYIHVFANIHFEIIFLYSKS